MAQYTETYSATATAAGVAEVSIRPPRIQAWSMLQMSVEMPNAPVGSSCVLRQNGNMITPFVPTGDVAAGEPPIQVLASDTMTVRWESVTPGEVGKVMVIYSMGEPL
jgi:hypothetical protein